MDAIRSKILGSAHAQKKFPAVWSEEFARLKAKLAGFVTPEQVQWNYPDSNNSIAARYARTIAAYRTNNVNVALMGIEDLIRLEPSNPYFQELGGQMLVDFGRVEEALPYYKNAIEKKPKAALIRIAYAHALLESGQRSGNNTYIKQSIEELETARQTEKRSPRIFRLLATAHGRLGNEVTARVNLAEEALLQGRADDAGHYADYVITQSPKGSRDALRARDILNLIAESKKEE
jgi:predicted Zn-dependent protease